MHGTEKKAGRRQGISLLEVLVSIFIVSVGLLGVISLFPVGLQTAQRGLIAERAAVVGRTALKEFLTRGWGPYDASGQRYLSPDDPRYSWRATVLDDGGVVIGEQGVIYGETYHLKIEVMFMYDADLPQNHAKNRPVLTLDVPYSPEGPSIW
jgi:hypothetical protein